MRSRSVVRARQLRQEQTDAEARLWLRLRSRQLCSVKFRRQERIGPFIVDFCSIQPKVVVEVDGGQHAERVEEDLERTAFLEGTGFRVLRFWNTDVLQNIEGVVERIAEEVRRAQVAEGSADEKRSSHPLT